MRMYFVSDVMMYLKSLIKKINYSHLGYLILFVFSDQLTKNLIKNNLKLFQTVEIFNNVNLVFVVNYGFAFGLFNKVANSQLLISFFLLIVVGYFFYLYFTSKQNLFRWAMVFIIGGAIGNILDRIFRGYVIDFIDVHLNQYHWPAFNLADSFISLGFILLVYSQIIHTNEK